MNDYLSKMVSSYVSLPKGKSHHPPPPPTTPHHPPPPPTTPHHPPPQKSDRVQPVRPAPALDTAGDRAVPGGLVSGEVKSHGKEELLYPL